MAGMRIAPLGLAFGLVISPAMARGGGGGGGAAISVHAGAVHVGAVRTNAVGLRHTGFPRVANPRLLAQLTGNVPLRRIGAFPNGRFSNGNFPINQDGNVPINQGLGFWGYPWGWGWSDPQTPVQTVETRDAAPQVIVIRTDDTHRMAVAEASGDVQLVKGCHAIPNGYHCGQ